MIRVTPAMVVICQLVTAPGCGGKVRSNGPEPGSTAPVASGELELVVPPQAVLDTSRSYDWTRVAARQGAFDVLAGRGDPGGGTVARRVSVPAASRALRFDGDETDVVAAKSIAVGVDGDLLAIAHSMYNGDPLEFTSFRGAYDVVTRTVPLFREGASCSGLVFHDGRGLLAAHKRPADRSTLSRAVILEITSGGALLSTERAAIADGGYAYVGLTAYTHGLAWAGIAAQLGVLALTFAPDGGQERRYDVTTSYDAETVPRMSPWPFDDEAVAVSWSTSGKGWRLVAMKSDGNRPIDVAFERPEADWVTRPVLAALRGRLLTAYSICERQGQLGEVVVELRAGNGDVSGALRFETACTGWSMAVASLDDLALVAWSGSTSVWAAVVR